MNEAPHLPLGVTVAGELIQQSEAIELDDALACGCTTLMITEVLDDERRRATCACGTGSGVLTLQRSAR
jgi:hypothetical protein